VLNAGEVEISGLELEMTAILTEGLRLVFNYGYVDAEYKEFLTQRLDPITSFPDPSDAATPITGVEDISGIASMARTPENNASAILAYDFQPFSWGELSARVEANYRDEMTFHDQLNFYNSTDDQTLINARATLGNIQVMNGILSVSAWGRNLNDEEYREWGIDFVTVGLIVNTFQETRSYGIDITYEFGRD